jgi:hypothetical protein
MRVKKTDRPSMNDRELQKLPVPATGRATYHLDRALPGFALRVSANGTRSWTVLYRNRGRHRCRVTLGTYPLVSLADARAKAKALLAAVVQGENPAAERRAEREAPTFAKLAQKYVERHAKPRKRSWREDQRILRVYVPKAWQHTPAKDISRRHVRELVEGIATRTPIMANRVLACLRKVFNYAIEHEVVDANPCVRVPRPGDERQRDRVLSTDELRRVWGTARRRGEGDRVERAGYRRRLVGDSSGEGKERPRASSPAERAGHGVAAQPSSERQRVALRLPEHKREWAPWSEQESARPRAQRERRLVRTARSTQDGRDVLDVRAGSLAAHRFEAAKSCRDECHRDL